MDRRPKKRGVTTALQRWAIDFAILAGIGLLMGFLGPFDSDSAPVAVRYAYWMICVVGGGLIGVGADELLRRYLMSPWWRMAAVSVLMTPPVTLLVLVTQHLLVDQPVTWPAYGWLLWQVGPITLAVMAVRALVWRRAPVVIETRTVIASPLPEAEATFRRRLSAKRREARLIAVEAHDHYLKVHTDRGAELITLRFADALDELVLAHGWQVHRSWWVAAGAVEGVEWRRGMGEIRLAGGLTAPVSRTYGPALKEAGWF